MVYDKLFSFLKPDTKASLFSQYHTCVLPDPALACIFKGDQIRFSCLVLVLFFFFFFTLGLTSRHECDFMLRVISFWFGSGWKSNYFSFLSSFFLRRGELILLDI